MRRVLCMCLLCGAMVGCSSSSDSPSNPGSSTDAGADNNTSDVEADNNTSDTRSDNDSPEAGVGSLTLSETTVDFGQQPCGSEAPAPRTLELGNAGDAPVSWEASLGDGSPFSLQGDASGTLAPGETATITIAAPGVPITSPAGALQTSTLTITSDDPDNASVAVGISMTAAGGVLTVSPADVGLVPLGTTGELPVTLTNDGNAEVTVSVGQPTVEEFALTWTGAPDPVSLAPGESIPGFVASFTPATAAPLTSNASLTVEGATCGASATTIELSGDGTNGVVAIAPGALDFGGVDCGSVAAEQTLTIENTGNGAVDFTSTLGLGAGSPYTVNPQTGTLAAGESATITVTPKTVPTDVITEADGLADTLTISTTAFESTPFDVSLHQTAQGARLAFSTNTIAFGGIPLPTSSDEPFTVVNTGNRQATVTLSATGSWFTVEPSTASAVQAAGNLSATATFTPPDASAHAGTISIAAAAGDVLCAPLPTLALSGTGTNGEVALSTGTLDFGTTNCGAQGQPQSFTVTNSGTHDFSWTATFASGAGALYSANPASGSLAPGEVATVVVTPAEIPGPPATSTVLAGGFNDKLILNTTGIVGDTPHEVELLQTAQGAILSYVPAGPIQFGDVPVTQYASYDFRVVNTGTADAYVALSSDSDDYTLGDLGFFVPAQAYYELSATFAPSAAGQQTATVTATPDVSVVMCAPPPTLSLVGTGTSGSVVVSPAGVDFGEVPCGTQPVARTVTISNVGTLAYEFSVGIQGGNHNYNLSTVTGTVDAGASVDLVISPDLVPPAGTVENNYYGDQITISTDVPGDTAHTVPLYLTAQGAIIELSTGGITFPDTQINTTGFYAFTARNVGNHAADISFAIGQANIFSFSPQGHATSPGEQYVVTAGFSPAAEMTYSDTAQVTVPVGTPVCGDLPSAGAFGSGVP